MTYLLDTDTVSFALRGLGGVGERLRSHRPSEVSTSAITVAELRFGAFKRKSRRLQRLLDTFFSGPPQSGKTVGGNQFSVPPGGPHWREPEITRDAKVNTPMDEAPPSLNSGDELVWDCEDCKCKGRNTAEELV